MSDGACWSCAGEWAPFCHADPPDDDDGGDLFTATGHLPPAPPGPCTPTLETGPAGTRARCAPCGWTTLGPAPTHVTLALYAAHATRRTATTLEGHP